MPFRTTHIGKFTLIENFLFWAQLWGFWHIVSQHYGFFALYSRKEGANFKEISYTKFIFYFPFTLFYLFFLFFHPFNLKLIGLDSLLIIWEYKLLVLFCLMLTYLLCFKSKLKMYQNKSPKAFLYFLIFLMYYGFVFILLTEYEPFYKLAKTPTQFFMLTSLMITLPHNLQYLYIVCVYLINGSGNEKKISLAFNFKILLGLFIFSLMICIMGYYSGEFVDSFHILGNMAYASLAYGIWWGFKIQHYYLDQKIWRFKNNVQLKKVMQVPE